MTKEQKWVQGWVGTLDAAIKQAFPKVSIHATDQKSLLYSYEVLNYEQSAVSDVRSQNYKTDLLIWEDQGDIWTPRVVIETKFEGISTHDALVYSAKAATHKQVHPHLRYGILVGKIGGNAVPGRLFRHGAHFDFMATWANANAGQSEWSNFINLLKEEITASMAIESFLSDTRSGTRKRFSMIHRRLEMK